MGSRYLVPFIVIIIAVSGKFSKDTRSTLLSVVQVFRHGERTPVVFYPTDPYNDPSYWEGLGVGQLTSYGKVQLTELGQFFRNRYNGFVSTNYSEEEIAVNSVTGARNFQSAESFLIGLYPDNEVDIPIEETPDSVLGAFLAECQKYLDEWLTLEQTNEYFVKFNERNSEVYEYITEHSGFNVTELFTALLIWDTLHIETRYYPLPEWTERVFPYQLTKVSETFAKSLCYDASLQRLGSGGFINELIQYFKSILSGSSSQKIRLYSVHDINIACALSTFQAFSKPHIPNFASSLIFELREGRRGAFVNIYYKPSNDVIPINLRGCAFDCRIEDFDNLLSGFTLSEAEWWTECSAS